MTSVATALHFRRENEKLSSSDDVLHKTKNLAVSRCCFADDGKEMDKREMHHAFMSLRKSRKLSQGLALKRRQT